MKKSHIIAVFIFILLGIALYYGYQYFQRHRVPLTLYGNVDTRSVNIGFRVAGRLDSLAVDEGDNVTEGQVLGKLDPGPYLDALGQAEANVASAKARLSLLEAGYRDEEIGQARADVAQRQAAWQYANSLLQRQQVLWGKRLISETTLDDARATRDQAQAALQSAKDRLRLYQSGNRPQQVEEARANLLQYEAAKSQALRNVLDTTLLAPSPGVVLTRTVEPGTILSASNSVFTLSLTEPVWIRAYVNEANLGKVTPGTTVEIVTDSRPDHVYHGKVGFVSPIAEFTPKNVETPDLRTDLVYRLRVVVSDADEALRQGMPVTLSVADGTQQHAGADDEL